MNIVCGVNGGVMISVSLVEINIDVMMISSGNQILCCL